MEKESKPVLLALLLVLAIIVVLVALVLVLKPYYIGKATENVSGLMGESAPSIASIPGDVSSCQIIDYGPGIYALDRNLNAADNCLNISTNDIVLDCRNYNITMSGGGTAISIKNVRNITVMNCNIYNPDVGMLITNSSGNSVTSNVIKGSTDSGIKLELNSTNNYIGNNSITVGSGYGVKLDLESGTNIVSNNTINMGDNGIFIRRSANNQISYNTLTSGVAGATGIYLTNSSGNRLSFNHIVSDPLNDGILILSSPYTVSSYDYIFGSALGVYMNGTNHAVINNLVSSSANNGISASLDYNLTIYNASIYSADSHGITMQGCSFVNISFSNITGSPTGVRIANSNYGYLTNNSVSNNAVGILINGTNHYLLNSNTLSNGGIGLQFLNSTNNTVISNLLTALTTYGIDIDNSTRNNISWNTLNNIGYYDIYVSADIDSECKNVIKNNSEGAAYNQQILYYNDTNTSQSNVEIAQLILCNADNSYFNNVTSSRNGLLALRANNVSFYNSRMNSSYDGIAIYYGSNNTFKDSEVYGAAQSAISLGFASKNRFTNVSVRNSGKDIKFGENVNLTYLNDSFLGAYDFGSDGGTVIFRDSSYGEIRFLRAINGSGQNLSSDVKIRNNSVYTNSDQIGLNRPANITLYGIKTDFAKPAIFRDNYLCPASACYNFTSLNAGTVIFNVTGWTNYSIAEGYNELTQCGKLNQSNSIYRLIQPISTNSSCFNITATNVTLECMDWSNRIVYGNSSSTIAYYGVYSNSTQTKVQNCEITMGERADETLERYAVYYYGGSNGIIINVNASGNRQGIIINSSYNNISGNIANYNSQTGIYLITNSNNSIINNTANNNKFGIRIYWLSDNNTIMNNTANNNIESGFYLGPSADNNYIAFNNATNNMYGVAVKDSVSNRILSNTLDRNQYSVFMNVSSSNTISLNKESRNSISGMFLLGNSNSNVISSNTITWNNASTSSCGIYIESGTGTSISSNNITGNYYGIRFSGASSNTVYNNNLSNIINAKDDGINNWNTAKSAGTNIRGGPYIGGNLWNDYYGWDIDGDGLGNVNIPHNSSGNIINGGDLLPLTEVNSVPNMTLVFLNSTFGTNLTTEDLACWANATEIDLDNVRYYGRWYKNNVLNSSFSTGIYTQGVLVNVSKVSSSLTRKGENWSCEVMASDGEYNSSYLISNNLTILNSAPYFNPDLANKTVAENSSLYYDINCSDADNDVLIYTINDSSKFNISSANGIIGGVPGFDDAGIYYYNISCGDNEANVSQIFMINVTNTNRIPELISLVVNSTYGTNTIYENITCSANATDADGGNLNYTGAWYRNGAVNISFSFNDSASGALANLSTLENSSLSIGENWTCYARVYDGENYSNYMRSNGVVILAVCGNAVCESGAGETCSSCPADCGSCPSGPSGGGGGGGRSPSTYSPSESQLAAGYTNNYYENDRMRFSFGNEIHYISVDDIGANSIMVTIYSLPMRITLFLGEPKKVDIDGDGYYDLLLRFEALRGSSADVLVQRIYESVSGPTYVPPQQPQPGEQIPPSLEQPSVPEEKAGTNTLMIVVIVLAVLIVVIILAIILIKLKAKRDKARRMEHAKKWAEDARKKGYSNKAINKILFKKDWTLDEIKEVMGHHHPEHEQKPGK